MGKTWKTVLGFAIVMGLMLGVWAVEERFGSRRETQTAATTPIAYTMDEDGATQVTLSDGNIQVLGLGAAVEDGVVTIAYPGTYRVTGTLSAGQLVVDCGDFDGGVYIILDNAIITCGDGPALYVKQADKTVVYLPEGTVNALKDGASYTVDEGKNVERGAGIYSADDLEIQGAGQLTVTGMSADGIRSKDGLTISGGNLTVYASDEALQGSDYVDITGGKLELHANGDGIATKKGDVTITGGDITIASAGDGISSAAALTMTAGQVDVVTYGGAENYELIAAQDISAKGLKAVDIAISGGAVTVDTADDGIHGQKTVTISGGTFSVRAGDDGIHAALTLDITGGGVAVEASYEALEAESITVEDGLVTLNGTAKGIDAGEDGFAMTGGRVLVTAPRCMNSDGPFRLEEGYIYMYSDGTDAPIKCPDGQVIGGTMILCGRGTQEQFMEKCNLTPVLFYTVPEQSEGQTVTVADTTGETQLTFSVTQPTTALLVSSGALCQGQEYTLTAGDFQTTALPDVAE